MTRMKISVSFPHGMDDIGRPCQFQAWKIRRATLVIIDISQRRKVKKSGKVKKCYINSFYNRITFVYYFSFGSHFACCWCWKSWVYLCSSIVWQAGVSLVSLKQGLNLNQGCWDLF